MASKILVVEDEEDYRAILVHALSREGYRVSSAANGAEALAAHAREGPDLVLLDVQLPDISGFEVCRRIRRDGPRAEVPIILCTIRSEAAPVSEGLASGATDYVLKPFNIADLLSRIDGALRAGDSAQGR